MSTTWRRLLHRWAGRLPTRIIEHDGAPLFERSCVWHGCVPLVGEVTVYLHHYLQSDPDRGLHDHPWPWAVALPLAGGYVEQRLLSIGTAMREVYRRRRPGLPYRLTGNDFHRVHLDFEIRTSWSLFITGRNGAKEWGFLRPWPHQTLGTPPSASYGYFAHLDVSGSHTAWWERAPLGRTLDRAAP